LNENVSMREELLLILHNLSATHPNRAKNSNELARILQMETNEVDGIMREYELEGYAESYVDDAGKKRYYLTDGGIIRICCLFT
jgi:DNA-binding MarR family transcriptional regulator